MALCESSQNAKYRVELEINGKPIELNNFVRNFIAETILGMVKPLRGVEHVQTLNLNLSKLEKAK